MKAKLQISGNGFQPIKRARQREQFPLSALPICILLLLAAAASAVAQSAQFFRISGPSATTIIAFQRNGSVVWSNGLANKTYTVQTVATLPGTTNNPFPPYAPMSTGSNWLNYIQLLVNNRLNTNLIVSFNAPAGMAFVPAGVFTMKGSVLHFVILSLFCPGGQRLAVADGQRREPSCDHVQPPCQVAVGCSGCLPHRRLRAHDEDQPNGSLIIGT